MIFLMRGTSCSGKSSFIKQYFDDENSVFSSDKFRQMVCGDIHVQQFNKQVFEFMHSMLDFRLAMKPQYTIYDATNMRIKDASTIIELSKKHQTNITTISISPPDLGELKRRNNERANATGFFVPESVLEKHYFRYFECMEPFLMEAYNNPLMKFIEIDQTHKVIREI